MSETIRSAFRRQAGFCKAMGSTLTARILDTLAEVIDGSTGTGRRILDWPGDPAADVLPLRIAGGLHGLARSGQDRELSELYAFAREDFGNVMRRVLNQWDQWLHPWLDSPPQTNEVGRSGALMAGLAVAAARLDHSIELLEIGASAGLNINLDRFGYRLGGLGLGPEDSGVQIAPEWDGPQPQVKWPRIVKREAVDQNPLDVHDDATAERLLAYCWPDQPERLARLHAAIAIARSHPPQVMRGDAADWIEHELSGRQPAGVARIVMHSVFWQYLPRDTQQRIDAAIRTAGRAATKEQPLCWLSFEPDPPSAGPMQLRLKLWPSGEHLHLAQCHPHGTSINWFGQENRA